MSPPASPGPPALARRLVALAERDPRRAVAFVQRPALGGDALPDDERAWLHFARGWALLAWERFDPARAAFAAALAGGGGGADAPLRARCGLGLALAGFHQDPSEAVGADLARATADLERLGAVREAAHAAVIRAALLNILGRVPEAVAALALVERQGLVAQDAVGARWRRVRAAAAYAQGDYAAADTLLEEAAAIFRRLGWRADLAKCWYEQGALAIRAERFELALTHYERAERVFVHLDLPVRRALCAHDCSHALIRLGAYDAALARLLRALGTFTAIGRSRDVARCYLLLGNLFWFTGAWPAALASYSSAEQLFAAIGMAAADRLTAQRNRALIYRATGRLDAASALLCELEHATVTLGAQADLAAIYHDQAAILADQGQIAAAHARFEQARAHHLRLGSPAAAAASRLERGWLLLATGEPGAARAHFLAAAPELEAQPDNRWRNDYGLARCAEAAGAQAEALRFYLRACRTVAALRGRLASELLSSTLFRQAEGLYLDALRLAVRLDDAAAVLTISDGQRALALRRGLLSTALPLPHGRREQYEGLLAQMRALDGLQSMAPALAVDEPPTALAAFGELLLGMHLDHLDEAAIQTMVGEAGVQLATLRAQLGTRFGAAWAALVYLLLDSTLVIITIAPDALALSHEPYDERLRRLIRRACEPNYRRYTYDDLALRQGQSAQPWAGLAELGARLIPAAARARLAPTQRLIVVPCGGLHALPWAALRLDQTWLAERAVLQLAPSVAVLQHLAERAAPVGTEALAIGCSVFHGRAPDLPGVADELALVAKQLPTRPRQLLDAEATCGGLLRAAAQGELGRYALIHIASHAQLLPAQGHAAHLKLWDGELRLADIARLKLSGALVVLSACEGAGAALLPGEEVLSLSRAFIAAGARGVVASLWPVHEGAALGLMRRFYPALVACGDAAEALAVAQRGLADGGAGAALASPRCWASFVVVGVSR